MNHQRWNLLCEAFDLISTKKELFFCYMLKGQDTRGDMLQQQFPSWHLPVSVKKFCYRSKMTPIFNVTLCVLLLQTVPATTHFYASICFVFTNLCNVPASCVLCMYTKGLVPASYPYNMPLSSMCQPIFCALSFFENPKNSHAKQGHKERQENCSWIEKSIQKYSKNRPGSSAEEDCLERGDLQRWPCIYLK